jgi:hypothetical protein
MAENIRRIIYLSLVIMVGVAVLEHLTTGETYSTAVLLLMVIIALGNIGDLHRRFKKPTG